MKSHIRFKCPACGMQVSQDRLNSDHLPFEVMEFHAGGHKKGRRGGFVWQKMNLGGAKSLFLRTLAVKLRKVADLLEMEALEYGRTSSGVSVLETSASMPPLTRSARKSESSSTSPGRAVVLIRTPSEVL